MDETTTGGIERFIKDYELKGELTDNCIRGYASVTGIMDRGRDVMFPKCFESTSCIKRFLKEGFVSLGHDWAGLPIAMPKVAKEDEKGLYTEAEFHSHEAAQTARTVSKERLDAGLSVGLSIGFGVKAGSYEWFESGEKLLQYAEEKGYDLEKFDQGAIAKCKGYCRGFFKVDNLYEYGIVTVPMNQKSGASAVKSAGRLPDHIASVLATAEGLIERLEEYKNLRDEDERSVSEDRRKSVEELHQRIGEWLEGTKSVREDNRYDLLEQRTKKASLEARHRRLIQAN